MDKLIAITHRIIFSVLTVIAIMAIIFMVVSYHYGYFGYSVLYWLMTVGMIMCMDLLEKEDVDCIDD